MTVYCRLAYVSYILRSWFSCRTASDRFQSPCVDSLSCHRVLFRFLCPSGNVHVTVFCRLSYISYIVCSWFSCRTASDRCQSPCVDSVSCQQVSFRFRRPSGNVDVTVFCHMYHILCVQGFHVGRLQTVDNLRVLIFCHANRSHFDSGVHLAMST